MKNLWMIALIGMVTISSSALAQNRQRGGGFDRGSFDRGSFDRNSGRFNRNNDDEERPVTNPPGNITEREAAPAVDGQPVTPAVAAPPAVAPAAPVVAAPIITRPLADAALEREFIASFGMVVDENIFLRDRGKKPAPMFVRQAPPPTPQQSTVLTGVVFEEGEFHAYFENLTTREVKRVVAGDEIADGIINEILFDAIAYEQNGQLTWVEFGQNLTGMAAGSRMPSNGWGAASTTPAPPAVAAPAPGGPPTVPVLPEGANMSIEERMKARRAAELQQSGGGN